MMDILGALLESKSSIASLKNKSPYFTQVLLLKNAFLKMSSTKLHSAELSIINRGPKQKLECIHNFRFT